MSSDLLWLDSIENTSIAINKNVHNTVSITVFDRHEIATFTILQSKEGLENLTQIKNAIEYLMEDFKENLNAVSKL